MKTQDPDTRPFDTGDQLWGTSPHYKQLAAALGDAFFHAPRRLLQQAYRDNGHDRQWTYHLEAGPPAKLSRSMGVFHGFDVFHVFGMVHWLVSKFELVTLGLSRLFPDVFGDYLLTAQDRDTATMMMEYWFVSDLIIFTSSANHRLNFINHLDPNGGGQAYWPTYGEEGQMLRLLKGGKAEVSTDDYRKEQIGYMTAHADDFHF